MMRRAARDARGSSIAAEIGRRKRLGRPGANKSTLPAHSALFKTRARPICRQPPR